MKKLLMFSSIVTLCGCAFMKSTTTRTDTVTTNGIPVHVETTKLNCYTLFDAESTIGKVSNRSGYTTNGQFGPGTYAGNINQTSHSPIDTNVISAAFKGLAEGMK